MNRYTDPRKSEQEIASMIRDGSLDPIAEVTFYATRIDPDQLDEDPNYDYEGDSGAWDPTFSYWEIFDDPESALIEEISGEAILMMIEDGEIAEDLSALDQLDRAIQEAMSEHLGALDSWDGDCAYASDAIQNYQSGISMMPSACATYLSPSVDAGDQLLLLMPS
jgi:tetrahydromethanopterin S-methyltransferase subunit B